MHAPPPKRHSTLFFSFLLTRCLTWNSLDAVFVWWLLFVVARMCFRSLGIDGSDFIGMFEGNPGSVENGKSTSLGRGNFLSRRSDSGGGFGGLLPTPPSGPMSGPMSNGGGNGGGGRRDSLGSNNWDSVNYDFGNLGSSGGLGGSGGGGHGGEPFEMDDLGLPFGGMDDFMSAAGSGGGSLGSLGGGGSLGSRGSHGGAEGGVGGLTSVTAGAANAAAAGMSGPNLATTSSMLPPAGRAASSSSSSATASASGGAAGAGSGGASSGGPLPSHATRRAVQLSQQPPSQHDRSSANSSAAHKASGGGGTQRRPAPHHHSAPCAITSAGTVNFPNSTDSGHKFPISNCVAELPSLHTLPPGYSKIDHIPLHFFSLSSALLSRLDSVSWQVFLVGPVTFF